MLQQHVVHSYITLHHLILDIHSTPMNHIHFHPHFYELKHEGFASKYLSSASELYALGAPSAVRTCELQRMDRIQGGTGP